MESYLPKNLHNHWPETVIWPLGYFAFLLAIIFS